MRTKRRMRRRTGRWSGRWSGRWIKPGAPWGRWVPWGRWALLLLGLGLATGAGWVSVQAAPPVPLQLDDLYRLDQPIHPVLSPQGQQLAYVRQWIDPQQRQERHSLWTVNGEPTTARAREDGEPDARLPVYSPDGRWIAVRSARPRPAGWPPLPEAPPESDAATDIWLVPTQGGAALPLTGPERPYGRVFADGFYGRVAFSPDSRALVFVADDGHDPRTADERSADVVVVRPDQGEGYTGYGPAQIWVARLLEEPRGFAAARIERLTHDDVWYGDPQWTPDGKQVIVHANRTDDRESVRFSINKNFDLWSIDVESHALRQLTVGPGPEVSPRISPDGRRLVCLSSPRRGPHADVFNLALVTLDGDTSRTTVLFDHHAPRDVEAHPIPLFPLPDECWDGLGHLIYQSPVGTATLNCRVDLTTGRGGPLDPAASTADSPLLQRQQQRQRSLPAGNRFLAERQLGQTKVVRWESEPGMSVEGVLTLPPPGVAQAPYKLLVHPHGGPHSRSTTGFQFVAEWFAARGYAVFQPNFRGSQGYGVRFLDADRRDFGGGDMRDILTGIDFLVREGIADPQRQYVYGTSYGGFLTTWLVGQTRQFRAAVAQNAVTDLNVMWGCSDLQSWTDWEFGGRPWEVPELLRERSPVSHVARVETPTLILHARDDRRVPLPLGTLFHQALRQRGVPTEMVVYPGEGHGIRQPAHRVDLLRRILAWFQAADDRAALGDVTEKHVMIPMRDGVRLSAYLYFPPGEGPWPVLYEQRYADLRAGVTRQSFAKLARAGYVVCAENFRGTHLSEGPWVGYRALGWGRQQDGYDTVEWLAAQPWSTGKIGTFGSSQAGFAQNFLAVTQPPHLACQYMIDTGLSLFHEGYRIGGTTRPERFQQMESVCRRPADNRDLLREWFAHPTFDAYWEAEDCTRHFDKMNVPCFTVGSWFDFMCVGSVDSYVGRQRKGGPESRGRQQLLLGPWLHGRFKETNRTGELEFPENARFAMDAHMIRWFDHYLKGVDNGVERESPVRYYVMGPVGTPGGPGNVWREAADWPLPTTPTPYYLRSSGRLALEPPAASGDDERTVFRADPEHPNTIPTRAFPGAADARPFEQQAEVRTFTSEPLAAPVEWTGLVRADLWVTSTARDTDFIVRVSDVYPDGRSILLMDYVRRARYRQGYEREVLLEPGQPTQVAFDVGWISQIFATGHRIRITVASTGAPFYEPNPNTGEPLTSGPPPRVIVATNAVLHSPTHASRIIAPWPSK
ncbi:MAG: CocE/NonD family hydrolase [Pirellulales bacterium]